ncbi:hypothetical protein BDC45DRAFT_563368 [Circinella umbellata]|nr:hypothetical protein BDC45DRAFT_563368 [Circinella umbellata]
MQLTPESLQSLLIDLNHFIHIILGLVITLVICVAFRAFPFHHDYSFFFSAARYLGLQHLLTYIYYTFNLLYTPVSLVSSKKNKYKKRKRYSYQQQQQVVDSIYNSTTKSVSELQSICLRDPTSNNNNNSNNFFGSSNNNNNNYYVSGLVNTGNTCFLNSVLQVLSSLPRLQEYLDQIQPSSKNNRPVSWFLATTLRRLTQPITKHSSFKPIDIVSLVSDRRINSRDQQDAQELFQLITSAIDVEAGSLKNSMSRDGFIVGGGLKDVFLMKSSYQKQQQQLKQQRLTSPPPSSLPYRLENPFTGLLASRLSCMQCGYTEAIRHFSFNNVQLTLPDTSSTTLEDCLKEFTAMEYLSDATCRKCALIDSVSSMSAQVDALKDQAKRTQDRTSRRTILSEMVILEKRRRELEHKLNVGDISDDVSSIRAVSRMSSKQVMFAKPPKILCLHLSRSTFHPSGAIFKNGCRIVFPEYLDLSSYSTNGTLNTQPHEPISSLQTTARNEGRYKLMGTIVHYGSHDFGHFIAYKRRLVAETCHCRQCKEEKETLHGDENIWYRISDEQVDVCTIDEVLQSNPYMLLYEYVTTPKSTPTAPITPLITTSPLTNSSTTTLFQHNNKQFNITTPILSSTSSTSEQEETSIEALRVAKQKQRQHITKKVDHVIGNSNDDDDNDLVPRTATATAPITISTTNNSNNNNKLPAASSSSSSLSSSPLQQGLPHYMSTRNVTRRSWVGQRRQSAPVISF